MTWCRIQLTCKAGSESGNCMKWVAIALALFTLQAKRPQDEQGGSIPWVEITQCLQRGGLIRSRLFMQRPSLNDKSVGCGLYPFCSNTGALGMPSLAIRELHVGCGMHQALTKPMQAYQYPKNYWWEVGTFTVFSNMSESLSCIPHAGQTTQSKIIGTEACPLPTATAPCARPTCAGSAPFCL